MTAQMTLWDPLQEWEDLVRDPANEAATVERDEITAGKASSLVEIVVLPQGTVAAKWEHRYGNGNIRSHYTPWEEFSDRRTALARYFASAVRHFSPISPYDGVASESQRRDQRRMQSRINVKIESRAKLTEEAKEEIRCRIGAYIKCQDDAELQHVWGAIQECLDQAFAAGRAG